jgi:hypothetical protein
LALRASIAITEPEQGVPSSPARAYPLTVRRIVPPALFGTALAGFVLSGLHSGAQGLQPAPASVGESQTRTVVYCIDATVGSDGKPSKQKCVTEPRKNANGKLYITLRPATTP